MRTHLLRLCNCWKLSLNLMLTRGRGSVFFQQTFEQLIRFRLRSMAVAFYKRTSLRFSLKLNVGVRFWSKTCSQCSLSELNFWLYCFSLTTTSKLPQQTTAVYTRMSLGLNKRLFLISSQTLFCSFKRLQNHATVLYASLIILIRMSDWGNNFTVTCSNWFLFFLKNYSKQQLFRSDNIIIIIIILSSRNCSHEILFSFQKVKYYLVLAFCSKLYNCFITFRNYNRDGRKRNKASFVPSYLPNQTVVIFPHTKTWEADEYRWHVAPYFH